MPPTTVTQVQCIMTQVVEVLCAHSADVNIADLGGWSSVTIAAIKGLDKVVNALLMFQPAIDNALLARVSQLIITTNDEVLLGRYHDIRTALARARPSQSLHNAQSPMLFSTTSAPSLVIT